MKKGQRWRYAPRPGLATICTLAGWAAATMPLLFVAVALLFAAPIDPNDLTSQRWLDEVAEYPRTRLMVLGVLSPIAMLALIATIGAVLLRWAAPLIFALGLWPAIVVLGIGATAGLEHSIRIALENAARLG